MADGGRFYEKGGRQYVSVTTFLGIIHKPGLEAWKVRLGAEEAKKVSTAGADKGTQFHFIVDQLLKGSYVWSSKAFQDHFKTYDPIVQEMVIQWGQWYANQTDKVISSERIVYSDMFGYAGQLDAETDKRIWDWKTSNYPSTEWVLQAHAYSFASMEEKVREIYPNIKDFDIKVLMMDEKEYRPKDIAIYNAKKKEPEKAKVFEVEFQWVLFDVMKSALDLYSFQRNWKYPAKEKKEKKCKK